MIIKRKSAFAVMASLVLMNAACKKNNDGLGSGNNGSDYPVVTDSMYSPTDPSTPASVGFFADGWQAKNFMAPDTVTGSIPSDPASDSLLIDVNKVWVKVLPYMYGNNTNLWTGQLSTQPELVQYVKDLSPGILRAPAGSVSDIYFWNGTDASQAPPDVPDTLLNADGSKYKLGPWYGGNQASWTFSLDNYYSLRTQTNSTGIITINYGYARYGTSADPVAAAAHLAADWVRYDNGRTKFWEIGNENYGNWEAGYRIDTSKNKDGQPEFITGALYGKHVTVFVDSMKKAAQEVGATIYVGALLVEQPPYNGAYESLQTWNQGVLANAGSAADYFIVHNYFTPYNSNSAATDILATGKTIPPAVMSYIKDALSKAGVPQKPIAFTEWNIQAVGSKQQISYISGMHAALTLGSMIKNGFGEASRWDLANSYSNGDDQGLFSLGDEPGVTKWNPRPAYYYLYYFQRFFGDRMVSDTLRNALNNTDLTTYSSTFSSGQASTVIINSGQYNHIVAVDFQHFPAGSKYYWYVLTGGPDNGSFSTQVRVNGNASAIGVGGPLNYATLKAYSLPLNGSIKVSVPAMSVVYLVADKK